MEVELKVTFGEEQTPIIDDLIDVYTGMGEIISSTKDGSSYTITFKNAFSCYSFGHAQASTPLSHVLKLLTVGK